MKIVTYNVNGIRASHNKGLFDWLNQLDADIICLQEVRASEELTRNLFNNSQNQLSLFDTELFLSKYYVTYNCGNIAGYSGTVTLSKEKPIKVELNLNQQDNEGRAITTYFKDFVVVNCYVPNGNKRLDYKIEYINNLTCYLANLSKNYEVIFCSDFNIAHTELDVSHPKQTEKRTGFLPQERELVTDLLNKGFIDEVRKNYPNEKTYTWRSYKSQMTQSNYGIKYRFDYILTTKRLSQKVYSCEIFDLIYSDHLPIILSIDDKQKPV